MRYHLFDIISVVEDIPKLNVKAGMIGAVIDIYEGSDEAYEVEFCDDEGRTVALGALLPTQITLVERNNKKY